MNVRADGLLTGNMQSRRGIDAAFDAAGLEVMPKVETDSMMALYTYVRCAGLYGVLPHSVLCLLQMRQEAHRDCYFEGRPIRNEYLIVQDGKLAGAGAHSYSGQRDKRIGRRSALQSEVGRAQGLAAQFGQTVLKTCASRAPAFTT